MTTNLSVPEILILPSNIPGPDNRTIYAWHMKLHEGETLDSEDHGDDFYSVQEALSHAYGVFEDLVKTRHLYPEHAEQVFQLTVRS